VTRSFERSEIEIGGQRLEHLLVHAVLPYSNWEWARVCYSESYLSLKRGLQSALVELGGCPRFCQTDQELDGNACARQKRKGNAAAESTMPVIWDCWPLRFRACSNRGRRTARERRCGERSWAFAHCNRSTSRRTSTCLEWQMQIVRSKSRANFRYIF